MESAFEELEGVAQLGISLNSTMGISSTKTMKLIGHVKGKEIMVIIDPDVTHTFISTTAGCHHKFQGLWRYSENKRSCSRGKRVQGDFAPIT